MFSVAVVLFAKCVGSFGWNWCCWWSNYFGGAKVERLLAPKIGWNHDRNKPAITVRNTSITPETQACRNELLESKKWKPTISFALFYFFHCSFLAVQNSSIGDLVTDSLSQSLTDWLTFTFAIQRAICHHQQGRIDFNTVNPSLSTGKDFLIHSL